MKVLVIGSGGREHALAWKLAQSERVSEVLSAPGNPGTAAVGRNVDIAVDDHAGLVALARRESVGLVVVGPEGPLCAGLGDALRAAKIPVFGPGKSGAEIEGSKAAAKEMMSRVAIPTAAYRSFREKGVAIDYLEGEVSYPLVVKASGLAGGKGVLICKSEEEALEALSSMFEERRFGEAADTVIIEEFLGGREVSAHCVTDGSSLFSLPTSQDYKRAYDGDEGPNTGGMGAVSPALHLKRDEQMATIEREVLFPTVHALSATNREYRGVVYAGIMMTASGPKVLEYNARFGDPETQVLLPRLKFDLAELLLLTAEGRLSEMREDDLEIDPRSAVTVVVAAESYPQSGRRGDQIEGVDEADAMEDVMVFQAGTRRVAQRLITDGGRILSVTALGDDVAAARARAYEAVGKIRFRGMRVRGDIAAT